MNRFYRLAACKLIYIVVLCLVIASLASCQKPTESKELKRISSPTGDVDAVFVEWSTNATSDFLFGFTLVDKGKPVVDDRILVTGSSLIADSVHWENSRTVLIEYTRDGQIYSFRNRWFPPNFSKEESPKSIEIVLSRR